MKVQIWFKCDEGEAALAPPEFEVFNDLSAINLMDVIVCFGGDGTVLHTASLFPGPVPPMLPVGMGSLGFMTPFTQETALVRAFARAVSWQPRALVFLTLQSGGGLHRRSL